jgi:8-oxo-dGTP pyrophosphatase MutT (NUDIX family)
MPAGHLQYGVLPWRRTRRGDIKVLLVTSRETARWLLPKGWPMEGKTPLQAARREAFEEAGVVGHLDPQAIGTYDYVKILRDGSPAPCTVAVFSLKVRGTLTNWPERSQRKRRWYRLADAVEVVSDEGLERLLASFGHNRSVFEAFSKAA